MNDTNTTETNTDTTEHTDTPLTLLEHQDMPLVDDPPVEDPPAPNSEELEAIQTERDTLAAALAEAQEALQRHEQDNATLLRDLELTQVSHEHGVPRELLQGNTREDMELFAAALKAWKADKPTNRHIPSGQLRSGSQSAPVMKDTRADAAYAMRHYSNY